MINWRLRVYYKDQNDQTKVHEETRYTLDYKLHYQEKGLQAGKIWIPYSRIIAIEEIPYIR